jgi:hypothetical protein
MVFFVAAQEVGLRLDMLRLLYFSSLDTFGMVLEPSSEMFLLFPEISHYRHRF